MNALARILRPSSVFVIILAVYVLNLNGLTYMWTGVPRLMNPVVLILSAATFFIYGLRGWGGRQLISYQLFVFSVLSYMALGAVASAVSGDFDGAVFLSLLISIFMLLFVPFLAIRYLEQNGVEAMERLLIALTSIAALFSFIFGEATRAQAIVSGFVIDESRSSGLFANPNEAAVVYLVGFAACLVYSERKASCLFLIPVFLTAIFLTYSRTALLALVAVLVVYLIIRRRFAILLLVGLASVSYGVVIDSLVYLGDDFLNLSQARRLESLKVLLGGDISEASERGILWQIGWERILSNPIFGYGVGEFHHLRNGLRDLGVHNGYLMIWGEAGFLPLLILCAAISASIAAHVSLIRVSSFHLFLLLYLIVFLLDMVSNHNSLELRFHCMLVAISFAALSFTARLREGAGLDRVAN